MNYKQFLRPDVKVLSGVEAIDRNDPESAKLAVEFSVPTGFSREAKACMEYFNGTAFIFAYKDKLVLTDESCELTVFGDGSHDAPLGGPRWIADSWEQMEKTLELNYRVLVEAGVITPEQEKKHE